MVHKNIEVVQFDKKTGEKIDGVVAIITPKKAKTKDHPFGNFVAMNSNRGNVKSLAGISQLYQLLRDTELTGECWRILWGLTFWLEWDNWVTVSQRRFAADMGIKPQNLSPILKILEAKGILERGTKNGTSYTFRFNPQILWKGDKSNLTVALHHLKSSVDNQD